MKNRIKKHDKFKNFTYSSKYGRVTINVLLNKERML